MNKGGNQIFEYSKNHQLAAGNSCLDTNGVQGVVKLNNCSKRQRSQQWDYDNMVVKLNYLLKLFKFFLISLSNLDPIVSKSANEFVFGD